MNRIGKSSSVVRILSTCIVAATCAVSAPALAQQNSITVAMPTSQRATRVKIVGLANSGWWGERIRIELPSGEVLNWESSGTAENKVVGTVTVPPGTGSIKVTMFHQPPGEDWQPSSVKSFPFGGPAAGLNGVVVGSEAGGRDMGPAYWNTLAFIYWAPNY